MMQEVRRGETWWRFRLGFGRIQRARALSYALLPDAIKRAQIANPDMTSEEAKAKLGIEELLAFQRDSAIEYVKLVLDDASDWDRAKMSKEEYVEAQMPEDIGMEITAIVQRALLSGMTEDAKKK